MSHKEQATLEGYVRTEYGIFPSDWSVLTLDDVCSFVGGAQPEKSVFSYKEQAGYIRLIQIRDYKSDKDIVYIPEKLARKKCSTTDIMIGRYGPPIFQILRGIKGAYNVALIKATPNDKIVREFLYYLLKNESLFELMDMLSQRSSGQTGVELPALKSYPIGLPPKPEQTAIAKALSDVDTLLTKLEKLVAKKQAIKTATMQQLLTGKTRLPQFATYTEGAVEGKRKGVKSSELGEIPEDWDVVELGDKTIFVGSGKTSTKEKGDFPLYGSTGQIGTCKNGDYKGEALLIARVGANAGTLNFVTGNYGVSDNTIIIKLQKDEDIFFYKYMLIRKNLNSLVFGSGQPLITGSQLKSLKIVYPKQEEQTAIATILSDMDNEIQTLEQRLAKTRQIKQGMMQELLTGRTRLPFDKNKEA